MKLENMYGNGKMRYFVAENLVLASLVSHGINEILGLDRMLGIDPCTKDVFTCALHGGLMGYVFGGSMDLLYHFTKHLTRDLYKSEGLEKNVS